MIKLNEGQKREPIGGHHFKEKGHMIKGETFDEVVSNLAQYRLDNSIPLGTPKMDVLKYYAAHFPFMVLIDENGKPPRDPNKDYVDWREWVWEMWRKPELRFITQKEAAERWIECSQCQHNRTLRNAESREGKEIVKKTFLLRRGENVPKFVGFCACHRLDIGIASFLEAPRQRSGKREDSEQPPQCWV